jgi:hypothetical protein
VAETARPTTSALLADLICVVLQSRTTQLLFLAETLTSRVRCHVDLQIGEVVPREIFKTKTRDDFQEPRRSGITIKELQTVNVPPDQMRKGALRRHDMMHRRKVRVPEHVQHGKKTNKRTNMIIMTARECPGNLDKSILEAKLWKGGKGGLPHDLTSMIGKSVVGLGSPYLSIHDQNKRGTSLPLRPEGQVPLMFEKQETRLAENQRRTCLSRRGLTETERRRVLEKQRNSPRRIKKVCLPAKMNRRGETNENLNLGVKRTNQENFVTNAHAMAITDEPALADHQVALSAIAAKRKIGNEKVNDEVQIVGKLEMLNIVTKIGQLVNLNIVGIRGNDLRVIEMVIVGVDLANMSGISRMMDWIVDLDQEM